MKTFLNIQLRIFYVVILMAWAGVLSSCAYGHEVGYDIARGDLEATKKYVEESAEDTKQSRLGTVLFYALDGQTRIVKYALEEGANPNGEIIAGGQEYTYAEISDERGHPAIARLLREYAVKFDEKRVAEKEADIVRQQEIKRQEAIAEKEREVRKSVGDNPLLNAIANGESDKVELLLGGGANPNAPDLSGQRGLHHAVAQGTPEIVGMLLAAHANPNAGDKDGITPFMRALEKDNSEIVRMMIIAKADMDAIDKKGMTPWHYIPYQTETGTVVQQMLSYTDDGWRDQRWFYEEDRLQKEWEQQAKTEEQIRIETELKLAKAREQEAIRRAKQEELDAASAARRHEQRLAQQKQGAAFMNTLIGAGVDIYSANKAAGAQVKAAKIAQDALQRSQQAAAEAARQQAAAAAQQAQIQAKYNQQERQLAANESQQQQTELQQQLQQAELERQQQAAAQAEQRAQLAAAQAEERRKIQEANAAIVNCVVFENVYENRTLTFGSLQDVKGPAKVLLNKCGREVNAVYCTGGSSCLLNNHTHMYANEGILVTQGSIPNAGVQACAAPHRPVNQGNNQFICQR